MSPCSVLFNTENFKVESTWLNYTNTVIVGKIVKYVWYLIRMDNGNIDSLIESQYIRFLSTNTTMGSSVKLATRFSFIKSIAWIAIIIEMIGLWSANSKLQTFIQVNLFLTTSWSRVLTKTYPGDQMLMFNWPNIYHVCSSFFVPMFKFDRIPPSFTI